MAQKTALTALVMAAAVFLLPLWTVEQRALAKAEETVTLPPPSSAPRGQTLRVLTEEGTVEMEREEYLVGVLRAEMPASFPLEALKAQAVAGRTYTLYQLSEGVRHEEADICTDVGCCQAYRTYEQARQGWGEGAEEYEQILRSAVTETAGEVLLYEEAPILAVFHAASAGLTRQAGEVWSRDLPYLRAVTSPEAGEEIPNYYSTAEFSAAEVKERFLARWPEMDFSLSAEQWLQNAVTDEAGSVSAVTVGGVTLKGTQVRSALGLRSACFTWQVENDRFRFFVTGYGHGVGMSQYGAAAMAKAGSSYEEILLHYYPGTQLGQG